MAKFTVRIPDSLKSKVDRALAKLKAQSQKRVSLNRFVEKAIEEKLERGG